MIDVENYPAPPLGGAGFYLLNHNILALDVQPCQLLHGDVVLCKNATDVRFCGRPPLDLIEQLFYYICVEAVVG